MIPITSGRCEKSLNTLSCQGIGGSWASIVHNLVSITALVTMLSERKDRAMGPIADGTCCWPSVDTATPWYGIRPLLGFKPNRPLQWLGILIEPPISVPHPTNEPRIDSKAPSPPEDPPGVKLGFLGWVVNPQRGFSVSHHMMLCGRLVFAMTIAPRLFSVSTMAASESAGAKARPT